MWLALLCSIFDAERGKIFKHSWATVQNFNEVMRKKRVEETNQDILKESLYE